LAQQKIEPSELKRRRVLVVEDDPASRRALVQLLQLSGFDVIMAATLADAVNQLAYKPDFVLLDLMLPDGTGSSILTYVREHAIDARVAVTTGVGDWKRALAGCEHAPDMVFTKPLDFDRVSRWLGI
jgi:two-component system response regulator QseB